MSAVLPWRRTAGLAGVVVLLGLVPIALDSAWLLQVSATTAVFLIAVIGYNLVLGENGLLSLGHAAFLGVGAYTYAVLADAGVWPPVSLLGAVALSCGLALVIGLLTLRVRHLYFAIATFGIAEILRNFIREWDSVTGGVSGFSVPSLEFGGTTLFGAEGVYPITLAAVVIAIFAHQAVSHSRLGRRARTFRDDELGSEVLGVPILRTSLSMFVLGAAFASIAGALWALTLTFIDPALLTIDQSILLLAMLIVGGSGSLAGAVIGTVLISAAPEALRFAEHWWEFVFGAVILLAILSGRRGLIGFLETTWRRLRRADAAADLDLMAPADHDLSPAGEPQALKLRDVEKRFGGVQALAGISATFEAGEIHALIGPNGSGKSTLVNVVTGLYGLDGGTVALGDRRLDHLRPDQIARSGVARTFQHTRTFAELSVLDNVLPMVETRVSSPRAAAEEARALLRAVGLGDIGQHRIGQLPHAHLRLLEIARALALRPAAVLLDEPAAGLSADERELLAELIRRMAAAGLAVVVIEHNMPFVLGLAQTVTVLEEGSVIASGSPDEITEDPRVQRAYLGEEDEDDARSPDRVSGSDAGESSSTGGGAT